MSTVVVVEIVRGPDGIYVAEISPVRTSHDLDTVASLESFAQETALVRMGRKTKRLTVFTKDELAYVRADDL